MILVGDCLEVMRTLDANSVDAIVTDPPYGLGFMGKAWDHAVPGVPFWLEMLRVAKPGAYVVAFGGTRTFHRMACAIEDAGWELRDTLMWVYGSGFPKSHNGEWGGTALKPAWEPIILARKLLIGTVEANWREHGTGALNIDGCRIGTESTRRSVNVMGVQQFGGENHRPQHDEAPVPRENGSDLGRWPANLIHDGSEEVVAAFPQSTSTGTAGSGVSGVYGDFEREERGQPVGFGDTGSAARFFYCAKASREDRNDGCSGMAERPLLWSSGDANPGSFQAEGTKRAAQNNHPTVKPTDLMRWLCRLVTPQGGLVLDPFAGSGSTGRGAVLEGFRFTGIELDHDYAAIAEARIAAAVEQRAENLEQQRLDAAQLDMFGAAA